MRIFGLLAVTSLVLGCRGGDRAQKIALTPLPGLGLSMRVPHGFRVRPLPQGAIIERDVRTHPSLRLTRTAASAPEGSLRRLANGAELYSTLEEREGGSGGEEQILRGRLLFGGATYLVECSDQGEAPGGPQVEWCVSALATLAH